MTCTAAENENGVLTGKATSNCVVEAFAARRIARLADGCVGVGIGPGGTR